MLKRWQEMLDDAVDRMHELLSGLGAGELDDQLEFQARPLGEKPEHGAGGGRLGWGRLHYRISGWPTKTGERRGRGPVT
jgi:hypothetical protein